MPRPRGNRSSRRLIVEWKDFRANSRPRIFCCRTHTYTCRFGEQMILDISAATKMKICSRLLVHHEARSMIVLRKNKRVDVNNNNYDVLRGRCFGKFIKSNLFTICKTQFPTTAATKLRFHITHIVQGVPRRFTQVHLINAYI